MNHRVILFAVLGLVCVGVGVADLNYGSAVPHADSYQLSEWQGLSDSELVSAFEPVPHYPSEDNADQVYYSSPLWYNENEFHITYRYVWGMDEEPVRVHVVNGRLVEVLHTVHWKWFSENDFSVSNDSGGVHPHIWFQEGVHTPRVEEHIDWEQAVDRFGLGFLSIGGAVLFFGLAIYFSQKRGL